MFAPIFAAEFSEPITPDGSGLGAEISDIITPDVGDDRPLIVAEDIDGENAASGTVFDDGRGDLIGPASDTHYVPLLASSSNEAIDDPPSSLKIRDFYIDEAASTPGGVLDGDTSSDSSPMVENLPVPLVRLQAIEEVFSRMGSSQAEIAETEDSLVGVPMVENLPVPLRPCDAASSDSPQADGVTHSAGDNWQMAASECTDTCDEVVGDFDAVTDGLEGELVQMELARPVTEVAHAETTGGFQATTSRVPEEIKFVPILASS